jgi:hypothetical protein
MSTISLIIRSISDKHSFLSLIQEFNENIKLLQASLYVYKSFLSLKLLKI